MPIPSPPRGGVGKMGLPPGAEDKDRMSAVGPALSAHGSLATTTTAWEKGHSSHIQQGAQPEAVRL